MNSARFHTDHFRWKCPQRNHSRGRQLKKTAHKLKKEIT
jgi:hypothetical protein